VTAASLAKSLEFCDFRRAFAQLTPPQREALLPVGASGLGYAEVAAICGCATRNGKEPRLAGTDYPPVIDGRRHPAFESAGTSCRSLGSI
jgi:hypothetical protein